ncbi:hypothetical protein Rhe02_32740 [Rhizocola hellebori]|uniref:Uncharacterized protein n=1 Tax=Rhizocola hellebori TaxID=1392758 RepID=A0A8J3Q8B3_9ACTN|nr:hypothetical protein Rhe02_32740 [Rhizocola hellebori]
MPALGFAFLPQPDQAAWRVEVAEGQAQRAATSAGGLRMKPQQQRVENGIVPTGTGRKIDLLELDRRQGAAGVGQAAWFGDPVRGAVTRHDDPISGGEIEQSPSRSHRVLPACRP